jgi:hypothetical protein
VTSLTLRLREARPNWHWLAQLGAVALSLGVVTLLSLPGSELSSRFGLSAPQTPVPTANAYGFSTSLDRLSTPELNAKLDAIKQTGSSWVRYDVAWDIVQPSGPSSYNWSAYDRVVQGLTAHHMQAIMVLDFTPSWARGASCNDSKFCPPANPSDYGRFAAAAASRYGDKGQRDWEIWNEPNISYRFHGGVNAKTYTSMLVAAYSAIKAVDPAATVITGGTAPAASDGANLTPADFIKALYTSGAAGHFDAVAAHPYTYPNSPADNMPQNAWGQLVSMHATMAAHGDGSKQIWATEFGAPTSGPDIAGDHVTEAMQAQILSDAISLWHSYSWAGPFMWYDYKDSGTSTQNSENFYGLVRADDSHKPSYDVWVNGIAGVR